MLETNRFMTFDILIFTETFLLQNFSIPGFYNKHLYGCKQDCGRPMRGVSIFYKAKLGKLNRFKILQNTIILNFQNLTIIASYFHPKMTEGEIWAELTDCLEFIDHQESSIFAGDYNCRLDTQNSRGETILDFAKYNDLRLVNSLPFEYTYVTDDNKKSVIDLIFASPNVKFKNFSVNDTFHRKHRILNFTFSAKNLESFPDCTTAKEKIDLEKLKTLLNNNYRYRLHENLTNEDFEQFYSTITELVQLSKSSQPIFKRTAKSWFDSECYVSKQDTLFLKHFSECLAVWAVGHPELTNLEKEILHIFSASKKYYRRLCKQKRTLEQERRDDKIIREAEARCYKLLKIDKQSYIANDIPLTDWQFNFNSILNENNFNACDSLHFKLLLHDYPKQDNPKYILEVEVEHALRSLKPHKAPGPDSIFNETFKYICSLSLTEITAFYNICLLSGKFPSLWKNANLKLLYKNKGDSDDMNNYRGISLSNSIYNLLDRIMKNRLYAALAEEIPENQFGFVRGRSTIQAINQLIHDIQNTVYISGKPLYALFLDIKKAFDSIDRRFIFQKLVDTKKITFEELNLIAEMMDINFLSIVDGVGRSEQIVQSNGVRQGGSLSPLLFIFSLFDINNLLSDFQNIKLQLYADDILITSNNLGEIQSFVNKLVPYLSERNLKLNASKSKLLKFRKKGRGRYKQTDHLTIQNEEIEKVPDFIYLGVKFQASGTTFTKHLQKRIKAAIFALSKLNALRKSSIETALKLFDLAIAPIASYGIEAIWPFLTLEDLNLLETAKSRFLKRALCLSKYINSRFAYALADTSSFIEDLRWKYSLPETESYNKFLNNQAFKMAEINPDFYDTPAMTDGNWKSACFENRNVFTRYSCHGYHYVLCTNKNYHSSASDTCKCTKCNQKMDTYHFTKCDNNDVTLLQASKHKF
jgi:hypothetical protein